MIKHKKKRAQATIFIILAIIVVAILLLSVYLTTQVRKGKTISEALIGIGFDEQVKDVEDYIEGCLKQTLSRAHLVAANSHPLTEDQFEAIAEEHMQNNLELCINLGVFENLEITHDLTKLNVEVTIYEGGASATLQYPVTIKKDKNIGDLDKFYAEIRLAPVPITV